MSARRYALLLAAAALAAAAAPCQAQDAVDAASPLAPLRASPGFVSPAQLQALSGRTWELEAERLAAREASTTTTGSRLALSYGWRANPSLTAAARVEHFRDATRFESASGATDGSRSLLGIGLDGTYKIMDHLVLALGATERRIGLDTGAGATTRRRYTAWQPAVMLKSEWYEIGATQTAHAINRRGDDGDEHLALHREYAAHATYLSGSGSSLGIVLRQNPLPECCLANDTDRRAYTAVYAAWTARLAASAALTYAPAFHERAAFGPLYDAPRYRLEALARYQASAFGIALTGAYERARDASPPDQRPAVDASGWRLGLALSAP